MKKEKTLVFENTKEFTEFKDIFIKKIVPAIGDIKNYIENIGLIFDKALFVNLIVQGPGILKDAILSRFKEDLDRQKMSGIYKQVIINQIDYETIFNPLEKMILNITESLIEINLVPNDIEFSEILEVVPELALLKLQEVCKVYTESLDETKLFKLIDGFCQASNGLQNFLIKNSLPQLFYRGNFFSSASEPYRYCTFDFSSDENPKMVVNFGVFEFFRSMKRRRDRKRE